jgi:transcription antitermination factor NusG
LDHQNDGQVKIVQLRFCFGIGEMNLVWYALHSKPRNEELLFEQLSLRKIETFYPRIRVQTVNPRARKVRAYFPGYVFVHVDLDTIGYSTLQWLPGATGLVSFGGEPASVPDGLIGAIRHKVERINGLGGELFDGLKPGDAVVIQAGPFSGYEAIFDEQISGNERVRVLLKLLQKRLVPVELPAGQVERKDKLTNRN